MREIMVGMQGIRVGMRGMQGMCRMGWECRESWWDAGDHCGKIVYKIQFNLFPEIEKIKKNKHSLKSLIFVLSIRNIKPL